MPALLALVVALQQPVARQQPPVASAPVAPLSSTTPPSRDTTGYWQQHTRYTIVATLDEPMGGVHARGTLVYVNRSPDTLRSLYFHQYLNAFRPHSGFSQIDEREGRIRFQALAEPKTGFERFTAPPTIDGRAVAVSYPAVTDSTVARLDLARALAPGDSVTVQMAWDARLSTVPRRQGRRGREFDFAQWYPKVAVYDRLGWESHPLLPAGELYGEFGSYDVTLIVPEDQVMGATGVPVSGDPGWQRALRGGAIAGDAAATPSHAYANVPVGPSVSVPAGYKAVRWLARDVHHFAWATSPDFRYEGGVYVRPAAVVASRAPGQHRIWDTVAVHVLYPARTDMRDTTQARTERDWSNDGGVKKAIASLTWLESLYGPYLYPQLTALRRIESGGTEFPMLVMNGGGSQSLFTHEIGHIYSYGMLANNEWRSGWMDEGLTSFQTAWSLGELRPEVAARAARQGADTAKDSSFGRARRTVDSLTIKQTRMVIDGRAQPLGLPSDAFANFTIYQNMIYNRAQTMFASLRDVMGDDAMRAFLRDYHARWALRHVDETAMRASAERAYGRPLDWFFDQWVHRTGYIDYALRSARVRKTGDGWETLVRLVRTGSYRHPMPVGVRTAGGWQMARGDALRDDQELVIRTKERPVELRLDPQSVTEDLNARHYAFPL